MKRRTLAAATAALTTVAVVPAAAALASPSSASGKTALTSSAVTSAGGLNFGASAPASTSMTLGLQLPLRNQALADRLLAKGTVLTPAQYAAFFAPSKAQVSRVKAWAASQGMKVTQVSTSSGQIRVSAPVSRINRALGVSVRSATANGSRGLAAVGTPVVPSNLGLSGISGLNTVRKARVDNAKQAGSTRSTLKRSAPAGNVKRAANGSDGNKECANYWGDHLYPTVSRYGKESNYICGYFPQDLTQMYGVKAAQTKAPTIGVLLWGNDPNMLKITNEYMTAAGYPTLKDYTATVAAPDKDLPACDPYGVVSEQSIDVQSSHSISPNSPIRYYGAASCTDAALTSQLQLMVDQHKVSTISMSFGEAYDKGMSKADQAAWDRPLQQAALTGISTFGSSGDSGNNAYAAGNDLGGCNADKTVCKPDGKPHIGYPASSAYITAVGGTSIGLTKTGSVVAAAGWENLYFVQKDPAKAQYSLYTGFGTDGAGGGVSEVSKIPTWQKGVVTTSSTMRAVPDVAGLANPYTPFLIRQTDNTVDKNGKLVSTQVDYAAYGGTSLASPIVAAIVALAKAYNNVQVGNAAPKLYALRNSSAITDINGAGTMGVFAASSKPQYGGPNGGIVIGVDSKPQNLVTTKGWDNVTGVGEPNGMNFIKAFK
ncbi:S53 family serine peptidase [Dermatophilaceae bacterium Sec6.4]